MKERELVDTRGLITPIVERIVNGATWLSRHLLGNEPAGEQGVEHEASARVAKRVDIYVLAFFLGEILIYSCITFLAAHRPWWAYFLLLVIVYRVIDIMATAIRIPLFDIMRRKRPIVASNSRVVILGLVNYGELILCFGTFYAFFREYIGHGQLTKLDGLSPLYLSVITQSTIGYGDLWPAAGLRLLACWQTFAAILVLILIIGRFVTNLPAARGLDQSGS